MSIIDKIKSNTEFESVENVKTFTNRGGLASPLVCVDAIIGGKIPFGSVVDLFGPPASGKSSYGYECIGRFQAEHPEGITCVIDTESSIDAKRLKALGVDLSRVMVKKGATLESGYKQIITLLSDMASLKKKERVPIAIIWDSLSNAPTEAQKAKGGVNSGGIAEAPRINKDMLKQLNLYLGEVDAIIFLINQVSSKIGMFVGNGWGESGGNALKHAVHYKLEFGNNKASYNELGLAETSTSTVKITKNKLGPLSKDIPFTISNTEGGKIDEIYSCWQHMDPLCSEKIKGNTYHFINKFYETIPKFHQYLSVKYPKVLVKFNWYDIIDLMKEDKNAGGVLYDFLKLYWFKLISASYTLQAEVIKPTMEELENKIYTYMKNEGFSEEYIADLSNENSESEDDEEDE